MPYHQRRLPAVVTALALTVCSNPAGAHEAWLLTPLEIEILAKAPIPLIFRSQTLLGLAGGVTFFLAVLALKVETRFLDFEQRVFKQLSAALTNFSLLILRLGLSSMLLLAATGGLPRHGTAPWTTATFLVPDMQLANLAGAETLVALQLALGALLMLGAFTRVAGLALVALSIIGHIIFGAPFYSYSPHFLAPGLILLALGGGIYSLDRAFGTDPMDWAPEWFQQILWRISVILIGIGFMYLGIAYKLLQPTLLIAILDHGNFPKFGLPFPVVALIMTCVEILCGALLVMGRLVRPVALAILGAITILAITLGETPLFHANLYGALLVILVIGRNAQDNLTHGNWKMVRAA